MQTRTTLMGNIMTRNRDGVRAAQALRRLSLSPWPADLVGKVREGCCLVLPQWPEEGWSFTCSVYPERLLWTIDMEK